MNSELEREVTELLEELAALSDDAVDEGDPALFGSFRDSARALLAKLED